MLKKILQIIKFERIISALRTILYLGIEHLNNNIIITGKIFTEIRGNISIGKRLYLRSIYYNPIEIWVHKGAELEIADSVFINRGVRIISTVKISIGKNVKIGDETIIMDSDFHGVHQSKPKASPIVIGDNVWIASRVILLKGISIGENSVIACGSVVTSNVPANCVVGGVPAKILKKF